VKTAGYFAIVVLIALAFTVLPRGGDTLSVLGTLLGIAFIVGITFWGYQLYRQYRFELDSLPERQRLVLYSSVGLGAFTLCATNRLIDGGGLGILAWLALLGLSSFGVYWVWTQYRSYG
jgi:hypothetical protein